MPYADPQKKKAYNKAYFQEKVAQREKVEKLPLKKEHPLHRPLIIAKSRAKRQGIPFDVLVDDIDVPTHCPVLGLEMKYGAGPLSDNSVSIDKFNPSLGYVRGNVRVISNRANMLKNNMTLAEWEAVGRYLRGEV